MSSYKRYLLPLIVLFIIPFSIFPRDLSGMISGKVLSLDGETLDYATVFLKGTTYSCSTNEKDCIT